MDNAAKALLYAGGILVGVLIISLAMYLYTTYKEAALNNYELLESYRVDAFNNPLTKYGNSSSITGYDAWNILAYIEEAKNDVYSLGRDIDDSLGSLTTNESASTYYKSRLFFIESCERTYHYNYEFGPNGVINKIIIN